jgi:ribose transport system substrate-binding protein
VNERGISKQCGSRRGAKLRSLSWSVLAIAVAAFGSAAQAETRAVPFPAWPEPQIKSTLTVDEAKAILAERTQAQTKWLGPTSGPKAAADATVVYVSDDQSYVSYVNWGQGVIDASTVLGWNVIVLNGKGTMAGRLGAMQQAVAMKPTAIVTSSDVSALQVPIKQAIAQGIPVIGIHATAYPGPNPELNLYTNITSNPAEIGQTQAAYVMAVSNGAGKDIHLLDNNYAIARFKAKAASDPIINCTGCKFLEMVNVPIADTAKRIPPVVSGLLARYGNEWYMTTCCDNFYPYVASSLRSAGVTPDQVRLIGSDGPPSAYDMIRKGSYEVATVPEPSTLFGFQAVDAIVRAMAGESPAEFIQPTFLVTPDNVASEGGDQNQFIPSNNFACHYTNLWKGEDKSCD